jgi:hypothetical protein
VRTGAPLNKVAIIKLAGDGGGGERCIDKKIRG